MNTGTAELVAGVGTVIPECEARGPAPLLQPEQKNPQVCSATPEWDLFPMVAGVHAGLMRGSDGGRASPGHWASCRGRWVWTLHFILKHFLFYVTSLNSELSRGAETIVNVGRHHPKQGIGHLSPQPVPHPEAEWPTGGHRVGDSASISPHPSSPHLC